MPWSAYVGQPHWRWRYLLANSFELAAAVAAVAATAFYLIDRQSLLATSVGQGTRGLAIVWTTLYGVGGVWVLFGLARPSARAEMVGISLYVPAALTNSAVILLVAPSHGISAAFVFVALAAAFAARGCVLWSLSRRPR